jgi:SAM-dependent methyltransferase
MGLHREIRRIKKMGGATVARYYARHLSNVLIRPLNLVGPARCECPCCGWHGARFLNHVGYDETLGNYVCPRCGSHARHRGLAIFLRQYVGGRNDVVRVLHFAPERGIASALAANPRVSYVTLDMAPHDVSVRADIGAIPFRDGAFELIICCHVLEHLPRDGPALAEIARVLAPGGQAAVMVPMLSGWEAKPTLEFDAPQPRLSDHWRLYGRDVPDRIAAAGLACASVRFASFLTREQQETYQSGDDVIFVGSKPAIG